MTGLIFEYISRSITILFKYTHGSTKCQALLDMSYSVVFNLFLKSPPFIQREIPEGDDCHGG